MNQDSGSPRLSRLGYVPALDGIRGIAALGVLLVHYLYQAAETKPIISFRGGYLGVDVFFALSGFLITTLLVEEHALRGSIALRAFWVRRGLRLMPALILALASLILLGALVDAGSPLTGQGLQAGPTEWSGLTLLSFGPGIVANLIPIANWVWVSGAFFNPLAVGWSLAVEDQFYLLWPFVLVLILSSERMTSRSGVLFVSVIAVAAVLWRSVLVEKPSPWSLSSLRTDAHAGTLLIGCAFGLAVAFGMTPSRLAARWLSVTLGWVSLAAILALFIFARASDPTVFRLGAPLIALLTTLLVVAIIYDRGGRLSRILSWPPLVGVGQVSYGLYLWHWIWLQYAPTTGSAHLLAAIVLTSVSVLASYYIVELPALRFKHRFEPTENANLREKRMRVVATRPASLPILGMSTLVVTATVVHVMNSRIYPTTVVASSMLPAATSATTLAPAATPTPAQVELPRLPQAPGRARPGTGTPAAAFRLSSRCLATPKARGRNHSPCRTEVERLDPEVSGNRFDQAPLPRERARWNEITSNERGSGP